MASARAFLRIDGVKGNSTDPAHAGKIELLTLEVREVSDSRPVPGTKPPPTTQINFTMKHNAASSRLSQAKTTGDHISNVYLEVFRADGSLGYRLTLSDVLVTEFQMQFGGHLEGVDVASLESRNRKVVLGRPPTLTEIPVFVPDHKGYEIPYGK